MDEGKWGTSYARNSPRSNLCTHVVFTRNKKYHFVNFSMSGIIFYGVVKIIFFFVALAVAPLEKVYKAKLKKCYSIKLKGGKRSKRISVRRSVDYIRIVHYFRDAPPFETEQ